MDAQRGIVDYLVSKNTSGAIIEATVKQLCSAWMRWYIGFDPAQNLSKLTCPVLAINGENDLQVPPYLNIPVIDSVLSKNGNKHFETHTLPGLNHLFQRCKKCTLSEYKSIDETMDPSALEVIGKWMQANVPATRK